MRYSKLVPVIVTDELQNDYEISKFNMRSVIDASTVQEKWLKFFTYLSSWKYTNQSMFKAFNKKEKEEILQNEQMMEIISSLEEVVLDNLPGESVIDKALSFMNLISGGNPNAVFSTDNINLNDEGQEKEEDDEEEDEDGDGNSEAEGDGEGDGEGEGEGDGDEDGDGDGEGEGNSDGEGEEGDNGDNDGEGDGEDEGDGEGKGEGKGNTKTNKDVVTVSNKNSDSSKKPTSKKKTFSKHNAKKKAKRGIREKGAHKNMFNNSNGGREEENLDVKADRKSTLRTTGKPVDIVKEYNVLKKLSSLMSGIEDYQFTEKEIIDISKKNSSSSFDHNRKIRILEMVSKLSKKKDIRTEQRNKHEHHTRMREYGQLTKIRNISERSRPDFGIRFVKKQPLVKIKEVEPKQVLALMIDDSGSMSQSYKRDWVEAIILNRTIEAMKYKSRLFVCKFLENIYHFTEIKNVLEAYAYMRKISFNGGNTYIQQCAEALSERIQTEKNITAEVMVINDGQDPVTSDWIPKYKTHAMMLGENNEDLSRAITASGGLYQYIDQYGRMVEQSDNIVNEE